MWAAYISGYISIFIRKYGPVCVYGEKYKNFANTPLYSPNTICNHRAFVLFSKSTNRIQSINLMNRNQSFYMFIIFYGSPHSIITGTENDKSCHIFRWVNYIIERIVFVGGIYEYCTRIKDICIFVFYCHLRFTKLYTIMYIFYFLYICLNMGNRDGNFRYKWKV